MNLKEYFIHFYNGFSNGRESVKFAHDDLQIKYKSNKLYKNSFGDVDIICSDDLEKRLKKSISSSKIGNFSVTLGICSRPISFFHILYMSNYAQELKKKINN